MKKSLLPLLVLVLLAGIGSGCRSFEKDWAAAAVTPFNPADPLSGRWIGTWQNTNNSHSGPLRAVIQPADPDTRTARFHASWGSHSGSFTSRLKVTAGTPPSSFTSRKYILGFLIKTRGQATATEFNANYESVFDSGTFTLRRADPTAAH